MDEMSCQKIIKKLKSRKGKALQRYEFVGEERLLSCVFVTFMVKYALYSKNNW